MQEGIMQIGKIIMQEETLLNSLTDKARIEKEGEKQHILKFNFLSQEKNILLDITEEMTEYSCEEYLYIRKEANAKQWYCTTINDFYVLSEIIPNLSEMDFGKELNEKLHYMVKNYFVDLGEKFNSNKSRYVLDFKWLVGCNFDIYQFYQERKNIEIEELKKILKEEIRNQFKLYLSEIYNIKLSRFSLFTILIDNQKLCDNKFYQQAVIKEKKGDSKNQDKEPIKGHCYFCGSSNSLRDDISLEIKVYTTNLLNFGSNTDKKNYKRNMLLCQNCLNAYWAGEKFIKKNLSIKIAKFYVYIYPHFLLEPTMDIETLKKKCEKIKNSFNMIVNIEKIQRLEEILNKINEEEDDYCRINAVFYKNIQQATKVQKLVKDINLLKFYEIGQAMKNTEVIMRKYFFKEDKKTLLNLRIIYYLFPIRENKIGEPAQFRNILEIYDCILTDKLISIKNLIHYFVESVKILYYKQGGYNISENIKKNSIREMIIRQNMFIKFLIELRNIEQKEKINLDSLEIEDELKSYIQEMEYNKQQVALFLLGCVIGNIRIKQYRKDEDNENKTILNRLSFNGMSKNKIIKLVKIIFSKVYQNKIDGETEILLSQFQYLFDKEINLWKLDIDENLYYILSGYSYKTMKAITNKQEKKDRGNKNE